MLRRLFAILLVISYLLLPSGIYAQYTYHCGGYLIHFHGVNGYVDAEDPYVDPTGLTLAAWVRCEKPNPSNMGIVFRKFGVIQGGFSIVEYGLIINNSGQFMFEAMIDTTNGKGIEPSIPGELDSLSSGVVPDSGKFYHIAATLDPGTFQCKFYVNGAVVASKTMKGALHWANNGAGNFYDASIGSESISSANGSYTPYSFFNGYIDDAFESNVALNVKQIDTIAAGNDLAEISFMNYHFSEGSGNVTYSNPNVTFNAVGYGNTGYLYGDYAWVNCNGGSVIANAGNNGTITFPKNDTILSAAQSHTTGNDGPIVKYLWTQTAGPGPTNIVSPNSIFTQVVFPLKGTYTFKLVVTDSVGKSDSASVQMTVLPAWANQSDSLALVALYNSTNGPGWYSKTGWLSGPVRNWQGVTISDDSGRVTAVSLYNNFLKGPIPTSITSLTDLASVDVAYNQLTFDGMESLAKSFGAFAIYSPQDSIATDSSHGVFSVYAGGTLSNNTYRWYLNGILDTTIIGNSSFSPKKAGQYYAEVTNSVAQQLTLHSKPINFKTELPFFILIDPNPSMINSDGSLNTNSGNIDISNIVFGGATDGLTKILLVANSNTPVGLKLLNPADGTLSGLGMPVTPGQPVILSPDYLENVVAVYTVPDGYGSSSPMPERSITVIEFDPANPANTNNITIKLITPPVVLIHGMWSGPNDWVKYGFVKSLKSAGYSQKVANDLPPSIFLADYSADYGSISTFDPQNPESGFPVDKLSEKISNAFLAYRRFGYAVTQADLVGLGLGGLMARTYSQGATFLNSLNYNEGSIHKLITIGTPHRGTPYGPTLWNARNNVCFFTTALRLIYYISQDNASNIASLFDSYTVGGLMRDLGRPIGFVHHDLGPDSASYTHLKQTQAYQSYAISGNSFASVGYVTPDEANASTGVNNFLQYISGKAFSQVFTAPKCQSPPYNDLTTEINSQDGGILESTIIRGVASPESYQQKNELSSFDVQDLVNTLLLSDDPTLFADYFPAPADIAFDCVNGNSFNSHAIPGKSSVLSTTNTLQNSKGKIPLGSMDSIVSVKIMSPTGNSSFLYNGATTIHLQYSLAGPLHPTVSLFMIEGMGSYAVSGQLPYDTTISMPANTAIGHHAVFLLVRDSTGVLFVDTSSIMVTAPAFPDSIVVWPENMSLDSVDRSASIDVEGYFGSNESNLSSGMAGTTYTTMQGNTVIRISVDGLVTAVHSGADTIIVANGGFSFKVPVTVDPNFASRTMRPNIIQFAPVTGITATSLPFALSADATSGDTVGFTLLSGPVFLKNGVIAVSGSGRVVVEATQPGNEYFLPAVPVYDTFCIIPASLGTIQGDTVTCPAMKTYRVSSQGGVSNLWTISEGGTLKSSDTTAVITWTGSGDHLITVTPITPDGCSGPASQLIVHVKPTATFAIRAGSPTDFCMGDSVHLTSAITTGIEWYSDSLELTGKNTAFLTVTQTGNYFAIFTDNNGCLASSDTIKVTVNPVPLMPTITRRGDSLLSSAATGNQWYLNNNPLPGDTNSILLPVTPGKYTVTATQSGCTSPSSDSLIYSTSSRHNSHGISIAGPTISCLGQQQYVIKAQDSSAITPGAIFSWSVSPGNSIAPSDTSAIVTWTTPGEDTVEVTESSNGNVVATANLIVQVSNSAPPPKPVLKLYSGVLASNTVNGNRWYLNDTLLSGDTSYALVPKSPGSYTVQVVEDSCVSPMSDPIIVSQGNLIDPNIWLFPNPADKEVIVDNRGINPVTVELFDVPGRSIMLLDHVSGERQIDLSRLSRGTYFLRITDEVTKKTTTAKLLKL